MLFQSYESSLEFLYGFHRDRLPADPRGEITAALLERLGVSLPQASRRVVHVTGTNGKGSTCAYVELILRAANERTVMLCSPHLNSVRERIRLDGVPIEREQFTTLMQTAAPVLRSVHGTSLHPAPTTIITILALLQHERLGPGTFGIYEVGSGGRHDSTNVFRRSVVGLTRVGNDHLEQFGGSLESVLLEKLGLCQQGGVLVHQEQDARLVPVLRQYCARRAIRRLPVANTDCDLVAARLQTMLLPGSWQVENAALASRLEAEVRRRPLDFDRLVRLVGARSIVMPGRLEARSIDGREFLLDGAHNEPAIEQLLVHFKRTGWEERNPVAILGFSRTRCWREMIDMVLRSGIFSMLFFATATRPKGVDSAELAAACLTAGTVPVRAFPSLRSALDCALSSGRRSIAVFGSLLLLGDFDKSLHSLGLSEYAAPFEDIDPHQPWMMPLA